MGGHGTRVCFIEGQGLAGSQAARDFADTLGEESGDPKGVCGISEALGMLSRGDVDYVVTADTPQFVPLLGKAMRETGGRSAYEKAWEGSFSVSYVVCSPRWLEPSDVKAVIADDEAAERTADGRRKILPENCVRYGCANGDVAAAGIRDRICAYMPGTAVVCSRDAAIDAKLHIISDEITDAERAEIPFVAIKRHGQLTSV